MKRRQFIGLGVTGLFLSLTKGFGFVDFFKNKTKTNIDIDLDTDIDIDSGVYIVKREYTSLIKPKKVYGSVKEFWADHEERPEISANSLLKKERKLYTTASYLSDDGKTVFFEKRYRSKSDHKEFLRLRDLFRNGHNDNHAPILNVKFV